MSVIVQGQITNATAGPPLINIGPFSINTSAQGGVIPVALSSGANTITTPTEWTPIGVVIQPPSGNAVTLTLKGVSGDTGVGLAPSQITIWTFPASVPATWVLTAGSTLNIYLIYF